MEKIISLSLTILLIFCLVNTVYASSPCDLTLEGKKELTLNEEFSVSVVISNIQDQNGIYVLCSTLEFDKDKLQFCGIENATGWAQATYGENIKNNGKGKILIERSGKDTAKNKQTVFRIKFKAIKDNVTNVNINLTNILVSNTKNDIKLGSIQPFKVNIGTNNGGNSSGNDNNSNNNSNNNNSGNNSNNNNSNSETNSNNTKPGNNNNSNSSNNSNNNNNNNSKPGNNNNSNSENNNGDNENNDNKDNKDENNEDINNNINNESSSNDENNIINREEHADNVKNGKLPSTGNTTNIIILVAIAIVAVGIILTILFIKIRKINKKEQM